LKLNTKNRLAYIFLILSLFSVTLLRSQPPIPAKPSPPRLVNDFAHLLAADEAQRLESDLTRYFDSTSTQITVVTLADLGDYEIVDWAVEIGKKWGVGMQQKNNGVVIIVGLAPRKKTFIATGYGVEGFLPDVICKRIVEQYINPKFREGRFYEGLNGGFQGIRAAAKGEFVNENQGKSDGDSMFWIFLVIMIAVLIFIIWSQQARRNNAQYGTRRRQYQDTGGGWIFWGGGGGFGNDGGFGGGGDSDSGSFGGFGGGDFGGGGAGGDW
jgi:uncharacterized protein